jgi:hypothetical protein
MQTKILQQGQSTIDGSFLCYLISYLLVSNFKAYLELTEGDHNRKEMKWSSAVLRTEGWRRGMVQVGISLSSDLGK